MNTELIVAAITLLGTALGTFSGIIVSSKLTNYRIAQLEKKVDKHNTVIERTYVLEERQKVTNHRLEDIEESIRKGA